jgi:predicted PurR-regulated permease PerM
MAKRATLPPGEEHETRTTPFRLGRIARDTRFLLALLTLLTFLALGFVINLLEPILLPLVVAVFLAQIFAPLMAFLRRRRVPGAISILLILILVFGGLLAFSWILYARAQSFATTLPRYGTEITQITAHLADKLAQAFPSFREDIERWRWDQAIRLSSLAGLARGGLGSFLLFVEKVVLVALFLVFLLAESDSFPAKIHRALAPRNAERVTVVLRNIEIQVRRYLLTKTLVNLVNGTLVTILMASFGVDFPLLWGVLTFLAHFIPQVGAALSVGFPTLFLFLQFGDSPGKALLVALLNIAIQFVIGSVVEPRILGTSLDLSPLVVLVSLIFWGWLWGPWGMVLAVPMAATIKIVCENIGPLRPISVLMSSESGRGRRARAAR